MKVIFLLAVICFVSAKALAQNGFKEGWIINPAGDTITGEINHRSWNITPRQINFRTSSAATSQMLDATQLKAFGVADLRYIAGLVSVEVSSRSQNSLSENGSPHLIRETVFLQQVFDGNKSLYHYRNGMGHDQFYILRGDSIEWLEYKKFIITTDVSVITYNNGFRKQLKEYFSDCSAIDERSFEVKYELPDLTKLFRKYYQCVNAQPVYNTTIKKQKSKWGIIAGLSYSSMKFRSPEPAFYYLTKPDYGTSLNATGGGFFEVYFNRKGKNLFSLYNELLYVNGGKYSAEYEHRETTDRYDIHYTSFGYSYLKLNNMLRYNFISGNKIFFLGTGLSNGFAFSVTNKYKRERFLFGSSTVMEGEAIQNLRRYEQGLLFGAGFTSGRLGVELRMERANGISRNMASPVIRGFALIGVRL